MSENIFKILLVDDEIDILEFHKLQSRKRRIYSLHRSKTEWKPLKLQKNNNPI